MILVGVALTALLATCGPAVSPDTMAAVVDVESAGNSLAIHDNTADRFYVPRDRASAEQIARALIASGHSVDLGLAQINSANLPRSGASIGTIFDPCTNARVGSSILASDYSVARVRFGPGPDALYHAIMAYNTGSIWAGDGYARRVVAMALAAPAVPSIAILTGHAPQEPEPRRIAAIRRRQGLSDDGFGLSGPLIAQRRAEPF